MYFLFELSSDELAFELSYEPEMKILASLYRVLQAIFSFSERVFDRFLTLRIFVFCLEKVDFFEFLHNFYALSCGNHY